jgi:nucleoside-diphosphate-sugar epimerase
VLPLFVETVKNGMFRWMDGGHYLTSTCHVKNVCEGMLLAAERGRGGNIYFLTDGPPIALRDFLTAMLETQGVKPSDKSVPSWLVRGLARALEAMWEPLGIEMDPPITYTAVKLMGEEVTVNDAKARRELGYVGRVTREEGLRELAEDRTV